MRTRMPIKIDGIFVPLTLQDELFMVFRLPLSKFSHPNYFYDTVVNTAQDAVCFHSFFFVIVVVAAVVVVVLLP